MNKKEEMVLITSFIKTPIEIFRPNKLKLSDENARIIDSVNGKKYVSDDSWRDETKSITLKPNNHMYPKYILEWDIIKNLIKSERITVPQMPQQQMPQPQMPQQQMPQQQMQPTTMTQPQMTQPTTQPASMQVQKLVK